MYKELYISRGHLTNNLHWGEHIKNMVSKGKRSLNFVMRNLKGASTKVRGKACTVMVRPVWDPHTKILEDIIEKVQQ
jgi:hypothetical protein